MGKKTREGFMCQIAFDHELGEIRGHSKVYSSVESLRRGHGVDVDECGIIRVKVTEEEIIVDGVDGGLLE